MVAPRWLVVTLVLALSVAAITIGVGLVARGSGGGLHGPPYFGTPVDPPKTAHDATLTDANGQPAHLLDAAFPSTFLFFGYTHCPDECPIALASLAKAYRGLSPAAKARTRIVFVSVDPSRDTPAVMKRYVDNFGAPIVGLTGSEAELSPVWSAYGVQIDARSREIGHGDAIYAIDALEQVVLIYTPDTNAANLRVDAERLAALK
jgi:protein SCO1/2